MTISEAKKIIEMCADAVKKGDGEEAKVYVNKEYVLQILDMVDPSFVQPTPSQIGTGTGEWPSNIREWHPDDFYPYGWPKISYKTEPKSPTDIYGNPVPYCGNDVNSTGSNPNEHATVITSAGNEPTHQFKEQFTTAGVHEATEGTHTV